jgi:ribonuclease HI
MADAKYKSYSSQAEAEKAFTDGYTTVFRSPKASKQLPTNAQYELNSICVDAASSGNPGIVEYQGVDTRTGERLFHHGPISRGTNNLGEFLAIVHGLAYLKKLGSNKMIYSDSRTAMKWIRDRHPSTSLPRDDSTQEIWGLVDRATHWLHTNTFSNQISKWETEVWGEIKADFGRK